MREQNHTQNKLNKSSIIILFLLAAVVIGVIFYAIFQSKKDKLSNTPDQAITTQSTVIIDKAKLKGTWFRIIDNTRHQISFVDENKLEYRRFDNGSKTATLTSNEGSYEISNSLITISIKTDEESFSEACTILLDENVLVLSSDDKLSYFAGTYVKQEEAETTIAEVTTVEPTTIEPTTEETTTVAERISAEELNIGSELRWHSLIDETQEINGENVILGKEKYLSLDDESNCTFSYGIKRVYYYRFKGTYSISGNVITFEMNYIDNTGVDNASRLIGKVEELYAESFEESYYVKRDNGKLILNAVDINKNLMDADYSVELSN